MPKTFKLADDAQPVEVNDLDKVIVVTEQVTNEQRFTLRDKYNQQKSLQEALDNINKEIADIEGSLKISGKVEEPVVK